jgi:His-Xaa-Ser system radical SAM maturase HxsC
MGLIDLSARLRPVGDMLGRPFIAKIATSATDVEGRSRRALILNGDDDCPSGFAAYLGTTAPREPRNNFFVLPPQLSYLADGDVVRIDPQGRRLHTLYRRNSLSNSLLVTERCDNFCVMCSQPPKAADDSWIIDELLEAIPMMDPATPSLGITGGEPGLLGGRLLGLLRAIREHLPATAVHILSNGRAFASATFAQDVARLEMNDLMIGVPLYSDLPEEHDYVVQARGAFDEAVRGILNLKRAGVRVEIRFVIHRETVGRMPEFAQYVTKNLLFVDQVALMGLEPMGFAKANLDALWVDPLEYVDALVSAVTTLDRNRVRVAIYNHQLCVLPPVLHPFAVKSISDWKNCYLDECGPCVRKDECGGFFASSMHRHTRGVRPFASENMQ